MFGSSGVLMQALILEAWVENGHTPRHRVKTIIPRITFN